MKDITKVFILDCDCHCGNGVKVIVDKYLDQSEIYISFYSSNFYNRQRSIFSQIMERFKLCFKVLSGGDYYLHDIVLQDKKRVDEFKQFIDKCTIK